MRLGLPDAADALLEDLVLVRLDDSLLDAAGTLGGPVLRSLDAIHLACAMRVPALTAVVTYDVRMQQAAQALGLPVLAPGTATSTMPADAGAGLVERGGRLVIPPSDTPVSDGDVRDARDRGRR